MRWDSLLDELLDDLLHLDFGSLAEANRSLNDLALAIDEEVRGDRTDAPSPCDAVSLEQDRIRKIVLGGELFYGFGVLVPRVDGQDGETLVMVLIVQSSQVRSLRTTGSSPHRPEGK